MTSNVIDLNARRVEPPDDPDSLTVTAVDVRSLVYSVAEVAQLLNLALGGTYALVRSGDIPARKLGGRWVIPKQAFHEWLENTTIEPDPQPHSPLPGQRGLF